LLLRIKGGVFTGIDDDEDHLDDVKDKGVRDVTVVVVAVGVMSSRRRKEAGCRAWKWRRRWLQCRQRPRGEGAHGMREDGLGWWRARVLGVGLRPEL